MFERDDLIPDRLYKDTTTGLYFISPDGVGCYWYDSKAQAVVEYGLPNDVATYLVTPSHSF